MIEQVFNVVGIVGPCGSRGRYRIGPIHFQAGWRKRRPEPGLVWFH